MESIHNDAEHQSIEAQTKQSIAELLELFTDIPAIPWPGRKQYHLPKYDHEVKVITDRQDRVQRNDDYLDLGPGVTMISLIPTQDYKSSLPVIYEFYYIKGNKVRNNLDVAFTPGTEKPVIRHASDYQDLTEPWHRNLDYPIGHGLGVLIKIIEVAKLKKEELNKT